MSGSTPSPASRRRGLDPLAFSQMMRAFGCYDIHERIRDMNVNGVLGSLNFPSLAGFAGQPFSTCPERDIGLELLRLQRLARRTGAVPTQAA